MLFIEVAGRLLIWESRAEAVFSKRNRKLNSKQPNPEIPKKILIKSTNRKQISTNFPRKSFAIKFSYLFEYPFSENPKRKFNL
jgi:hypothetical protein